MLAVCADWMSSAASVYSSEGLSMVCAFAIEAFVRLSQLVNDNKVHMSGSYVASVLLNANVTPVDQLFVRPELKQ